MLTLAPFAPITLPLHRPETLLVIGSVNAPIPSSNPLTLRVYRTPLALLPHRLGSPLWMLVRHPTSPPGITTTRLPSWLLPSLPPPDLSRLRPDLLIFHGLPITDYTRLAPLLASHDPTTLAHLRSTCLLYIVGLTYTSDEAYNLTLHKKTTQHHLLISLLLRDGWRIASAPVPKPLPSHLQWTPPPIPSVSPSVPPSRIPPVCYRFPTLSPCPLPHLHPLMHPTSHLGSTPPGHARCAPLFPRCPYSPLLRVSSALDDVLNVIFTFSRTPLHRSFSHLHDPP